ncbi:MAG: TonB-dependent receptor, partial [Candidatus Eremiobacteraeota bacterium]|nr:TonB-dependent receptor [Candidatus Eremiobacteraeota bacterium]
LRTQSYSSANDLGIANLKNATGLNAIPIVDAYGFNAPTGQFLPANYQALTAPYYLPFTPGSRPFAAGAGFASVPSTFLSLNDRDSNQNNQGLVKLQYQKNFGSNAYLRVYGYSGYSDWLINGQNYTFLSLNTFLGGNPYDYELSTHTRGLSGTFADQINAQNLIQFQGSFTTASVIRDNNTQPINAFSGSRQRFAVAVDSTNPTNGFCYRASGAPGPATPAYCSQFAAGGVRATYATLPQAYAGTIPNISGSTCGGGPCAFYVAENGQYATFNQVKPNFVAFSLSDTFKPNDRLTLNFGLRFDSFQYKGASTAGTAARTLFFNAANMDYCLDATGLRTGKTLAQLAAGTSCAALGLRPLNLVNVPADNQYPVWQPRLGFTYSLSPDSVIRGSYGRYAQAPNSAFEQYNTLYQDLPNFLTTAFTKFGFNSPGHRVVPETSNNFDVSLEHHFKGTDTSFKLTPFYRVTQNQIQTFFLDQPSNFVSGLNANSLTSRGLEFQLNKGDFGRDGFAMQLAFTYTNAYAKYYSFANGNTIFTGINTDIQNYNGFTSFCGTNPGDARCTGTAANAVPCFTAAGAAAPGCPAGSIANPYFNAPVQGLVDPKGQYVPFSLVTAGIGAASNSYLTPYVSTLVVQYKKGAWAFTPSLQFQGGQRYGAPETTPGIDPTGGCGALATGVSGDPRYPYGAPGGSPFDAPTCNATLVIPNPLTRQFDPIGSFVAPNQLVANMQISYKASKNVTFRATMANIMSTCFGGSNVPWNNGGSQVCGFGYVSSGNAVPFYGNVFNPGSSVQPIVQYPYQRYYGAFNTDGNSTKQPFSIFFDAQIKF